MKELENAFRNFIFFDQILFVQPIHSGHINDTFKVSYLQDGKNGAVLLQKLNHSIFKQPFGVMENINLVAEELSRQRDYQELILNPIPTLSGKLLHEEEGGNYWRAFPFFENTKTFLKVENENQAFEAARAFGAFLKGLENIEVEKLNYTIPDFHNGVKRLDFFKKVINKVDTNRKQKAQPFIDKIIAKQDLFSKIAHLKLPLRVTHNDTKISNVLFDQQGEKAVCVIDLDTVMPGIVLSDFGDMVRTFTNSGDEDEADLTKVEMRPIILKALMDGFLSEIGDSLISLEKENLMAGAEWIILMQAIRFLTDYLQGDPYYKIDYKEHNLVRTKNQLKLLETCC